MAILCEFNIFFLCWTEWASTLAILQNLRGGEWSWWWGGYWDYFRQGSQKRGLNSLLDCREFQEKGLWSLGNVDTKKRMAEGAERWNAIDSGLEQTSQEVNEQATDMQEYGYRHEISTIVVHTISYLFWWNFLCVNGWSTDRRGNNKGIIS